MKIRKADQYCNRREDRRYYFPAPAYPKYSPKKMRAEAIVRLLSALHGNWYDTMERIYRYARIREVMRAAQASADPEVIGNCLRILGMRGATPALAFIIPYVDDPSSFVRQNAAGALAEIGRMLRRRKHTILAKVDPAIDERLLRRFAISRERQNELLHDVAAGRISRASIITEIFEPRAFAWSLGEIGYRMAIPVLLESLSSSDETLSRDAANAITLLEM